jgi:hypothetical protein
MSCFRLQAGAERETQRTAADDRYTWLRWQMRSRSRRELKAKARAEYVTVGTVRCEGCGEDFLVAHDAIRTSLIVAEH